MNDEIRELARLALSNYHLSCINDDYPDVDTIDMLVTVCQAVADECPAGGQHVPTFDSSHPDRMHDEYPHCDECGASLPKPEKEAP